MAIWRMWTECRILKATDKHSECVILFTFPLQHWLNERASMSLYACIAALVICLFILHFIRWWSGNSNHVSLRHIVTMNSPHLFATRFEGNSAVPLQCVPIFVKIIIRYSPALLVFVTKIRCSSVRYDLQSCVQF